MTQLMSVMHVVYLFIRFWGTIKLNGIPSKSIKLFCTILCLFRVEKTYAAVWRGSLSEADRTQNWSCCHTDSVNYQMLVNCSDNLTLGFFSLKTLSLNICMAK